MDTDVHSSTVHNNQETKTARVMSTDSWMDKEVVQHAEQYCSAIEKSETTPFTATWMQTQTAHGARESKANTPRCPTRGVQTLTQMTYLWDTNRIGDTERTCSKGETGGSGSGQEWGLSTCKLWHTERRNSKAPLQSRGSPVNMLWWATMGKNRKKNAHTLFYSGLSFPWRRECQPTLVFLLGWSHGQRSLAGYSPWCCKAYTTEYIYI